MFSIRSILSLSCDDVESVNQSIHSNADVIQIDLNGDVISNSSGGELRSRLKVIFDEGRLLLIKLNVDSLKYLNTDISNICSDYFVGLVVDGVEAPQDIRDADVALRKYEGDQNLQPGFLALFPEISSVEGLVRLSDILESVDRIGAVFVNCSQITTDFGDKKDTLDLNNYILFRSAFETRAKRIPWVLAEYGKNIQSKMISTAYNADAFGVVVTSEAQVLGINSLFTPSTFDTEKAQKIVNDFEKVQNQQVPELNVKLNLGKIVLRRAYWLLEQARLISKRKKM
tara:strand:+ start:294 stop:1148 length:855 start_codon:yes stop_codon:yes gene_type:complete